MNSLSAWLDLRHGLAALVIVRSQQLWQRLHAWYAHRVMRYAVHLSLALGPESIEDIDDLDTPWTGDVPVTQDTFDLVVARARSDGSPSEPPTRAALAPPLAPTPSPWYTTVAAPAPPPDHYLLRTYADLLHEPYCPPLINMRYLVNRLGAMLSVIERMPPNWEQALPHFIVDLLFTVGTDRVEDVLREEVRRAPLNLQ